MTAIPTLDISEFLHTPGGAAGQRFVRALRAACHGSGFCYIEGHGIERELEERLMAAARRFFTLPQAERHAIAIGNSPHFRGYTILGDERTQGKSDWREQLDLGPEEPAASASAGDPPWRRLRGPNQWPQSMPEMQAIVAAWLAAIQPVGMAAMRALALGLGQGMTFFDDVLTPDPYTRVKIIHYPLPEADSDTGQGVGLHHDSGLLTFILQDETPGLQVQLDGKLIEVYPKPGTYVMNLGEMLQSATNGYLRATKHRVQSPGAGLDRISIGYFLNPRLDARFEPIDLPPALAGEARGGQNPDPDDPIFDTFGYNTLKIRMRAHPDVAAAFYSDVKLGART